MNIRRLRWWLGCYPPLLGAGIRVDRISEDALEVDVSMSLRWYNRNLVGTHFGGSLYAMTDPFFMMILMQKLGPEYIVWDQAASIEFVAPGRGTVRAHFRLSPEEIERVRREADAGAHLRPVYPVEVLGDDGTLVARVIKTLYVRRKRPAEKEQA
jgi:acyl-coenzyme A thioesterase PaaI-like protein